MDPGAGGFYIPDAFAPDEQCIPDSLKPLQRFNIRQTATNRRVVNPGSIVSRETLRAFKCLYYVRPRTIGESAGQLLSELWNKRRANRRTTFQAIVMWDAFRKLFDRDDPPRLSTFYTNHVASCMHRYWDDVFPEDFGKAARGINLSLMEFAMKVLDRQLRDVMFWCKKYPDLLAVFCTSMGQAAIHRGGHQGAQILLQHFAKLAQILGIDQSAYVEYGAMDPQVAIRVPDPVIREQAQGLLSECKTLGAGRPLFAPELIGESIIITVNMPPRAEMEKDHWVLLGRKYTWSEGGMKIVYTDVQTGDHVTDGAMALYGAGVTPNTSRDGIANTEIKSLLLELAGLEPTKQHASSRAVLPTL